VPAFFLPVRLFVFAGLWHLQVQQLYSSQLKDVKGM